MALDVHGLMLEYVNELTELLKNPAVHDTGLHTSEAATSDVGGSMKYCPGCRLIIISRRLVDMAQAQDDVVPQKRFGGKSRKDEALERLNEHLAKEKSEPASSASL